MLERCHLNSLHMGFTHPVRDTVKFNRVDVMRAVFKVRCARSNGDLTFTST